MGAIARDPSNADACLVYADWLQAQGDPRGELIALQVAHHTKPKDKKLATAETAWFRDHSATAFGPLASRKPRSK